MIDTLSVAKVFSRPSLTRELHQLGPYSSYKLIGQRLGYMTAYRMLAGGIGFHMVYAVAIQGAGDQ